MDCVVEGGGGFDGGLVFGYVVEWVFDYVLYVVEEGGGCVLGVGDFV